MRKLDRDTKSFHILKMLADNPTATMRDVNEKFPKFNQRSIDNLLLEFKVERLEDGRFSVPIAVQDYVNPPEKPRGEPATRRDINVYARPAIKTLAISEVLKREANRLRVGKV